MRFNNTILNDSLFIRFSQQQLLIIKADFPQRKKLPATEVAQNETLASRYNPQGEFPKLLLLSPDETILKAITYNNQSSRQFIEQISNYLHAANMLKEYSLKTKLMGSAFEFIVTADNKAAGEHWLKESVREVKRIEELFTEFSESSQTSLINQHAGIKPVIVDNEVYNLIERSNRISKLCNGAFDITAGSIKRLYNFKGESFNFPAPSQIQDALEKSGYRNIQLNPPNQVFLKKAGMRIAFGAIGKGYAADKVKQLLQQNGITSGVINASGDLTAWGTRSNGEPWKMGVAHPDDPSKIILWLPINNLSVATSGNYFQFFEWKGNKYSHNIDPRSGLPVKGIKSVTIISPGAELSDALATAVTVLGVKEGLSLINQLPQTHCIAVDEKNKVYYSKNLNMQMHA